MTIEFRAIDEEHPGPKLRAFYRQRADAYAAWYLRDGEAARPSADEGILALRTHMPELLPVYEQFVEEVANHDAIAPRMFTFLRPPASLVACSQGVWRVGQEAPVLVRNYDYSPELMDGLILRSRFVDRTVVGTTDGIWGLCDGMNDRGLVVSLTFGGRVAVGDGFGMPLVVRYLLECCETVEQVRLVLERLPYAQAYNLTFVDSTGEAVTAYLGPDRRPSYRRLPVATNHQWVVESWDPAQIQSSVTREWWLIRLLDDPDVDAKRFSDWFLAEPLYSFAHVEGLGTVYTAAFSPSERSVTYRWPGFDWPLSLETFVEGSYTPTFPLPLAGVPAPLV
ncbi:MAG: C45 family autoproteolytic acyltransferase/hydrolase [Actinomycetota bacterium]|nr:C45 family autoproteolytic acyltransferase/hydrolase [Actinomycetota bacterium]